MNIMLDTDESVLDTLTLSDNEVQLPAWGKLVPCLFNLESIVLYRHTIKIGRAQDCDVVISRSNLDKDELGNNLSNVSKVHCVLTKEPGKRYVSITDLSKNGTFLNGVKIGKHKTCILKDNDNIALSKDLNMYIFHSIREGELPDTVTTESSLSLTSPISIRAPVEVWGRLVSTVLHFPSFDLSKSVFKLGRSYQNDAIVDNMEINPRLKKKFSKDHFVIFRNPDTSIVYLTDLSSSGTYLNGRLIGRNKQNILQHEDTISIGSRNTKILVFKSMSPSHISYLPKQLKEKYEISIELGKGACGQVRLAYEKTTCKLYAIKRILKGRSTLSQIHKLNHPSKIENEIKILQSMSHPFIIQMKDIVETDEEVFIVLEYMEGGELRNRILSNVPLTESNAKYIFYQMTLAVQYLHINGITHRDLKPENVLLSSVETDAIIKISDFGLSKITEEDDMMQTTCGTLDYVAPEVLDCRTPEYDNQVDIWSLGVILFYMLSKQLPFKGQDRPSITKLIISGTYDMDNPSWTGISYLAKDLVAKMLKVDPQERIKISEILIHPWLAKDVTLQYRVHMLMGKEENFNTNDDSNDINPRKRIRLSSSDECTSV